jgi:hypothetical protein
MHNFSHYLVSMAGFKKWAQSQKRARCASGYGAMAFSDVRVFALVRKRKKLKARKSLPAFNSSSTELP